MTPTGGRLSLAGAAAVAAAAVVVDQVTKSWALEALTGRDPIHLLGSLQLALAFNSGVAFSLGAGSGVAVAPVALLVVGVVVYVARSLPGRLAATAVGLVVGGAVGNLVDRLLRDHDGAVVDFIDLQWWPVFNIADACIVVGGLLLALCSLRRPPSELGAGAAGPRGEGRALVNLIVPASLGGERIDKAVALLTGLPRSEVNVLVEAGAIRIGGSPVASRSRKLVPGDELSVDVPPPVDRSLVPDPSVEVPVVFADDHVLVVDKPAGLVVHPGAGSPGGTMVHGLLAVYADLAGVGGDETRPGIVHRLDAGTSGLLVVARTDEAHADLVAQLSARTVERRYRALVHGLVSAPAGLIDGPLGRHPKDPTRFAVVAGGKEARTRYEVVDRCDGGSGAGVATTLLVCRLESGRTHQIRVHLAALGHPVAGDVVYGGRAVLGLTRPYLHAFRLAFDHPATGERVAFESPVPEDLVEADAGR